MADAKDLVVLDMLTPVVRRTQRAGSVPCPMDIDIARHMWDEQARLRPAGLVLSPLNRSSGFRNAPG